jgi:protocatechuate 3,4-dioxygenase beta subunit
MQDSTDRADCSVTGRRRFLGRLAGIGALAAGPAWASAALLTPRQTAGPFYPAELPLDDDNDLVHVAGRQSAAKGEITDLGGHLLDRNGRPLRDTRIEIWQCDANGRYRHPMDPGSAPEDPGFQGIGHTVTDRAGRYRFLTIKPVPYPGRTRHIHVAVYPEGERPFVTQLYVQGEPLNQQDFLYQRLSAENQALVTVPFEKKVGAHLLLQARWDIVLGVSAA